MRSRWSRAGLAEDDGERQKQVSCGKANKKGKSNKKSKGKHCGDGGFVVGFARGGNAAEAMERVCR